MNTKLWNRDFTMVVIGQIISLFGNAIMRFALPLYLLNQTGSAALFGLVSACAFIPMIILAPIGGALYSFFGIIPILTISVFCFLFSAVMEIFIHIPFEKKKAEGSIFSIGFNDLKESFQYMRHDEPLILKVSFIIAGINMILSALVIIGLPIIVTQTLPFEADIANSLYGYAQGGIAAGSLAGGVLAGVLSKKLKAQNSYLSVFYCALTLIPIGLAIAFPVNPMLSYIVIVISCFVMMLFAALFSVQMMAYLQMIVPNDLLGKVISCAMCVGMCASPLGQAIYGGLFQLLADKIYIIFIIATIITCVLSLASRNIFKRMSELLEVKYHH